MSPRRFFTLVFTIAIFGAAAEPLHAERPHTFTERKIDGAELRYVGDIPIATLSGAPEQMGRQHAELVKEAIPGALELPKRFAADLGLGILWPLMTGAGRTLMLNTPKEHQRELAAFAAAGGYDEGAIAVANTLLELRRMGCSSLVVEPNRSSTGGPLFGRNFDFPTLGELDKYSLVTIYHAPGRRPFASIGFPAFFGVFSGMNDAGLAVATLDVEESADGSLKFNAKGTPLAFVFRRILEECATVDEAEKLLKSEKPTTWMNLAVCDREGGAVFEITPDHIARRNSEQGMLRCTNHVRTAGLSTGESCERYDKLLGNFQQDKLDVEDVHVRLDNARQDRLTFQTMVFEPRELVLHLALSEPPSSDKPLKRIELRPYLAPAVLAK
jgi:hypothetical protein